MVEDDGVARCGDGSPTARKMTGQDMGCEDHNDDPVKNTSFVNVRIFLPVIALSPL